MRCPEVLLASLLVAAVLVQAVVPVSTQSAATNQPTFDVVSVKPNRSSNTAMRIDLAPGGRFTASNLPLIQFIRAAYTLQLHQIEQAPSWAVSERFDVIAITSADISGPVVWTPGRHAPMQLMMQSVLADRFKMVAHMEERNAQGYALVVRAAGSTAGKLIPAATPCAADCGLQNGPGIVNAHNVALAQFAELLSQVTGRLVVDATELAGNFDFAARWAPESAQGLGDAPSLFTALQEQLGLRLEPRRVRLPVLVVDSIQRPDRD